MAFNSHHSASWSDGSFAANNSSIDASAQTDSISWADIQKALDATPSLSGTNYGKGAIARSEATPPAGAPDGNFLSVPSIESSVAAAPRLNSSLLRVIGNLQRRDGGDASAPFPERGPTAELVSDSQQAAVDIGLAIAPGADVHQPGRVARAVVRLPESERPQPPAAQKTEVVEREPLLQPVDKPFQFVSDEHAAISMKFDSANVKYGRTTLLPDGRVVETQTAADNTTLTTTSGENGAKQVVTHDRYRRPTSEQDTRADGTWSFSKLAYDDSNGIKPFCSEKLTIHSDGSQVRLKFSNMGQIESKQTLA